MSDPTDPFYPPQQPSPYGPLQGPPPPQAPLHIGAPPQGHPQQMHVQFQQPVTDGSKRFLNMSTSALVIVLTVILLVCCIGPIALCMLGGVLDGFKSKPTVTVTSCEIDNAGILRSAKVGLRATNTSSTTASYSIKLAVQDSSGARVGDGWEYVSDVAGGETVTETATIILDSPGGRRCVVTDVS